MHRLHAYLAAARCAPAARCACSYVCLANIAVRADRSKLFKQQRLTLSTGKCEMHHTKLQTEVDQQRRQLLLIQPILSETSQVKVSCHHECKTYIEQLTCCFVASAACLA